MLINNKTLEAIKGGEISVIFRIWKRPTVKKGGTLTTRKGVLSIVDVEQIDRRNITDEDLKYAGLASRDEVCEVDRDGDFYKITVGYHGEDPRIALRENTNEEELKTICLKLKKMGDWTTEYLQIIKNQPNIHAQILAESVGREKSTFKTRVRRLKTFGLTEPLRPGYRVSKRGEKILELLLDPVDQEGKI